MKCNLDKLAFIGIDVYLQTRIEHHIEDGFMNISNAGSYVVWNNIDRRVYVYKRLSNPEDSNTQIDDDKNCKQQLYLYNR